MLSTRNTASNYPVSHGAFQRQERACFSLHWYPLCTTAGADSRGALTVLYHVKRRERQRGFRKAAPSLHCAPAAPATVSGEAAREQYG